MDDVTVKKTEELGQPELTGELSECFSCLEGSTQETPLTLILLTWTIWRAPTNASKRRMGFNSAFKGLIMGIRLIVFGRKLGKQTY